MPGRQSHGRSLLPASGPKKARKQSSRARASKALDAFAIAEQEVPVKKPKGVRTRDLDEEIVEKGNKRQHDDDDEDEDDDEEDDAAPRKKKPRKDAEDDFDGFSGGEDNEEWHVGVEEGDEDSDINSDEAFGESDEERFGGYKFGGKKKAKKGDKDEEDEEDDDDESLGSDAIDLATALDQWEEDESVADEPGSESEGTDGESSDESSESDDDDDDDEPADLDALQNTIAGFASNDKDGEEPTGPKQKAKISLRDLELAGVNDPHIKKSLKLMNKEEKATKTTSKKLDVPLAKRQQDKVLRSAAYEKTTETLDRWIETVKQNRRADHLVFPLAQNAQDVGLGNGELMPLTNKTAGTELEQTILTIMEESGLGPTQKPKNEGQEAEGGQEGKLTMAEQIQLAKQRRKERERHDREAARAKRIKKIKSKAYRRIHRKEALREEQANQEEAGDLDSEEEREAADRRRALERMGTKHRESKWAKLGKKAGRAVWDDDFRTGLTEMAQRKDELRRRVEGQTKGSDNDDDDEDDDMSDASGDSDPINRKRRLLEQLDKAEAYDDDGPESGLMAMKFMQRGEAERKKENDKLVAQIRRELDSDREKSDDEEVDIGRRQYGAGKTNPFLPSDKSKPKYQDDSHLSTSAKPNGVSIQQTLSVAEREPSPSAHGTANPWLRGVQDGRKAKKVREKVDVLEIFDAALLATKPKPKPKTVIAKGQAEDSEDSDDEAAVHLPVAIRDQELIKRAFGGEDVAGEFEREKAEIEKEDDDKEIDNTLPGWGGWVGEGISNREKKRHQGRFVKKVEGIKQKDRQDFKLKGVIIAEKRIKKNDKYLASQLPHPFESHHQYERSLRLPVGPEWSTKETFQQATKPRVILKQGIITPMSKPMV